MQHTIEFPSSVRNHRPLKLADPPVASNPRIESLGTYVPPQIWSSREVVAGCSSKLPIPLEFATGIEQRHCAGPGQSSLELAVHAVRDCLDKSCYLPADIDVIVCCNISKAEAGGKLFTVEPTTAIELRRRFGLRNSLCFDVNNACAGLFTGMQVVSAMMRAGAIERALVVSGEYITHLTDTAQKEVDSLKDLRLACLTLGDSGVALLFDRSEDPSVGLLEIDMATISRFSDLCVGKPTEQAHGGAIMYTRSKELAACGIARTVVHTHRIMADYGWTAREADHLVVHQISKQATRRFREQFNAISPDDMFEEAQTVDTVARLGNTSTTTHILAMHRSIMDGTIHSGERTVFSITASGLTIGTALYRFDDLPERMGQMTLTGERPNKQPVVRPHVPRQRVERPVVAIESIGVQPADAKLDSRQTATAACDRCLARSFYAATDVDLLIAVGVYNSEAVGEPSNAALIACALELNHDAHPGLEPRSSFVFDLYSGGIGWLQAAHVAQTQLQAGVAERVMIAASEAENNIGVPGAPQLGLGKLGTATLLHGSARGEGFSNFHFETHEAEADAFRSRLDTSSVPSMFHYEVSEDYESRLLSCLAQTLQAYLRRLRLRLSDFVAIVSPRLSASFDQALADRLDALEPSGQASARLRLDENRGSNLLTSSQALGLSTLHEERSGSGLVLVLAAGAGIQVGCALYHLVTD